jgi:hypothetical protein
MLPSSGRVLRNPKWVVSGKAHLGYGHGANFTAYVLRSVSARIDA